MGDRGVGQQAFDVLLHQAHHRTDHHGRHRDGDDDRLPVPARPAQGHVEHPQQRGHGGRLGGDRHETGHWGRGAGVDIRGPGVERYRTHLEQQPDGQHHQAGQQQHRRRLIGDDGLRHTGVGESTRVAVQQRHTEQEERRTERAEQEVLQRGLLAQPTAAPRHPGEQVQRQGEDLQGDEQRQQVVGGREQQHPEQREQDQREDFGVFAVLAFGFPLHR